MVVLTAEQMREMDRASIEDYGVPGVVLMENAGRGCADVVWSCLPQPPQGLVAIVAGGGNNGGDGFVVARHLINRGVTVITYLLVPPHRLRGDAQTNFHILDRMEATVVDASTGLGQHTQSLERATVVVDAIFGTGLQREVTGLFREAVEVINALDATKVAVDLPSGLDSDKGVPLGVAVRAHHTATFAFLKRGLVVYPGVELAGQVTVVDIGMPQVVAQRRPSGCSLMDETTAAALLPPRPPNSHKGTYGHLLVVAGSVGKAGAASLCCEAAVRSGAGLVTLATPIEAHTAVLARSPEVMTEPLPTASDGSLDARALERIKELAAGWDALAVGPGLGVTKGTMEVVRGIIEEIDLPLVVDADGINILAKDLGPLRSRRSPLLLTPHPGEMGRLTSLKASQVQADRLGLAAGFATDHNVYLLLKGARTVVASPQGEITIIPTGNPAMATGGTGDVLTGLLGSLLAQRMSPWDALRLGAYAHGLAGDLAAQRTGPMGLAARDIIDAMLLALHSLRQIQRGA